MHRVSTLWLKITPTNGCTTTNGYWNQRHVQRFPSTSWHVYVHMLAMGDSKAPADQVEVFVMKH